MRIAIDKKTGVILEMQSDATEGTLLKNAQDAGFSEVEEREVTPEEYKAAMLIQEPPAKPPVTAEALLVALEKKGVISRRDLEAK